MRTASGTAYGLSDSSGACAAFIALVILSDLLACGEQTPTPGEAVATVPTETATSALSPVTYAPELTAPPGPGAATTALPANFPGPGGDNNPRRQRQSRPRRSRRRHRRPRRPGPRWRPRPRRPGPPRPGRRRNPLRNRPRYRRQPTRQNARGVPSRTAGVGK